MSRPSKPNQTEPERGESFEERIDMLFEELSFAIKVQRPSILFIPYGMGCVRDTAELALELRLAEIGQQLVSFPVDDNHFDIPLLLSQHPDRDRSIFSVTGLSRGGGKAGANAYRALNIRRELFVDRAIRVIIWLARDETIDLANHAPDFWAFRHRVVDFDDSNETCDQSLKRLKQDLAMARKMNNVPLQAKIWGNLGSVYRDTDQQNRAVRAYWKAIRFTPRDAGLWRGVGHLYHVMQRFPDAIMAYRQVIFLDARDPSAHAALVACYRLSGKNDQAEEQKRLAEPVMLHETEYNRAIFESACGNTDQALELLAIALEKKQAGVNETRHNPNFDFIRDDPRFKQVLGADASNVRKKQ